MKLRPDVWQALVNRGRLLEALGRYEAAIEDYERGLTLAKGGFPVLERWLARAKAAAAKKVK
jgi:tetratricopeptide (TPR) repeat protein